MKNANNYIFNILICFLLAVLVNCSGKYSPKTSSAYRARESYRRSCLPIDPIIENRKKLKHVFKIMQNSTQDYKGCSVYNKIKKYDIYTEWNIIYPILQPFFTIMDFNNNPDTRENEWILEMKRRIKYCDDFFGKWWENDDLRAHIVIQLGVDDLFYYPPWFDYCKKLDGSLDTALCDHCQLSYAQRGIFIQLQGKYGLGYFTEAVPYVGKDGFTPQTDAFLVHKYFRDNITQREDSPYYDALPESKKDLKLAENVFIVPLPEKQYEIWSLYALPLDQYTADISNNIHYKIEQTLWSNNKSPEIISQRSTKPYSIPYGDYLKKGCVFLSIKNILQEGKYKIISTPVEPGTQNKSIYRKGLRLPFSIKNPELSNILLFLRNVPTTSNANKVQIGNKYFTGSPFRSYKTIDTLHALVCWPEYDAGESIAIWYLSPKEGSKRGKEIAEFTEKYWTAMREFDFPALEFMEETDIVLSAEKSENRNIYSMSTDLSEIPSDEYVLMFLLIEPRLKNPAKVVSSSIRIK